MSTSTRRRLIVPTKNSFPMPFIKTTSSCKNGNQVEQPTNADDKNGDQLKQQNPDGQEKQKDSCILSSNETREREIHENNCDRNLVDNKIDTDREKSSNDTSTVEEASRKTKREKQKTTLIDRMRLRPGVIPLPSLVTGASGLF